MGSPINGNNDHLEEGSPVKKTQQSTNTEEIPEASETNVDLDYEDNEDGGKLGRLFFTVVVLKARNLPKMDITGLSDPYVKIYLMYNNQRISKKKTHVKKRTLNPVF